MKIAAYLLALATLLVAGSCENDCDSIHFVDPLARVEQDIVTLDSLLRAANRRCPLPYTISFDHDPAAIQVHEEKESTDLVTRAYFCDAVDFPRARFQALAARLKRNEIRFVYTDAVTGINVFAYCNTDFEHGELVRNLILDVNDNRAAYGFYHKVMDKKGKLLLMALHDRD